MDIMDIVEKLKNDILNHKFTYDIELHSIGSANGLRTISFKQKDTIIQFNKYLDHDTNIVSTGESNIGFKDVAFIDSLFSQWEKLEMEMKGN